jgi:hypothetical protein
VQLYAGKSRKAQERMVLGQSLPVGVQSFGNSRHLS